MKEKEVCIYAMSQRVKVKKAPKGKKGTVNVEEISNNPCKDVLKNVMIPIEEEERNFNNVSVYDLTAKVSDNITEYEGFESTTNTIIKNLARVNTNKIAIIAQSGAGKNTLVKHFANKINREQIPKCFSNTKVLMVDNNFFDSSNYIDVMESVMKSYYEVEKATKFIWVFDKFEDIDKETAYYLEKNLQLLEDQYDNELNLLKYFMIMDSEIFQDREEIYKFDFWKKTIGIHFVEERNPKKIIEILSPEIRELETIHGTSINKELLILTIYMMYGKGFNQYEIRINYTRFLSIVDYILAIVKLDGRKKATKQDIITAYENDFKVYNEYSEFDKKRIAYHEAGHTILALALPNEYELLAVKAISDSISDAAGITIIKPKGFFHNKKGLIKTLAFSLGGRVAEEIYGHRSGEGAMSDLDSINYEAVEYVSRCGANKKFGKNFVADPEDLSPKQLEILEEEAKKIISKAYKYAKKVLKENEKFLVSLSKELHKEGLLTGEEVIKMWNKYLKEKNKDSTEKKSKNK